MTDVNAATPERLVRARPQRAMETRKSVRLMEQICCDAMRALSFALPRGDENVRRESE